MFELEGLGFVGGGGWLDSMPEPLVLFFFIFCVCMCVYVCVSVRECVYMCVCGVHSACGQISSFLSSLPIKVERLPTFCYLLNSQEQYVGDWQLRP